MNFDLLNWIKSLNHISEMILDDVSLALTAETILEDLNKHMGAFAVVLYLVDDSKKDLYMYSFTKSVLVRTALKILPRNIDVHAVRYPLHAKEARIVECVTENKLIESKNLKDFFDPVFAYPKAMDGIQKLMNLKLCVAAPVRLGSNAIGALLAVSKRTKLLPEHKELLQYYSNICGIAIENNKRMMELANKYEMERETTALLGHELRTPIAITYNHVQSLQLLLEDLDSGKVNTKKWKTMHRELKSGLEYMDEICNSILNLRELENAYVFNAQNVDLKHILTQLLKMFQTKANKKNLEFHYSLLIPEGKIFVSGIQFEQVLTILIDNAIKYTVKGMVDVSVEYDKGTLKCSVKDTGKGISKKDKEMIFERFYRSKVNVKMAKGLGLGLYLAKKIVDQMGGEIEVSENPDKIGSCFRVTFPALNSKQENKAK